MLLSLHRRRVMVLVSSVLLFCYCAARALTLTFTLAASTAGAATADPPVFAGSALSSVWLAPITTHTSRPWLCANESQLLRFAIGEEEPKTARANQRGPFGALFGCVCLRIGGRGTGARNSDITSTLIDSSLRGEYSRKGGRSSGTTRDVDPKQIGWPAMQPDFTKEKKSQVSGANHRLHCDSQFQTVWWHCPHSRRRATTTQAAAQAVTKASGEGARAAQQTLHTARSD